MKKIPTAFLRDEANRKRLTHERNPACGWLFSVGGIATRKWDGTAVLIQGGVPFARYDAKPGRQPPEGFMPAQEAPDPVTLHWPGWVPVGDQPEYRWHREAFLPGFLYGDGTYELCGPKVQRNAEAFEQHVLVPHGGVQLDGLGAPLVLTDFDAAEALLRATPWEGIVFYHPEGREHGMAKLKRVDFGIAWPIGK